MNLSESQGAPGFKSKQGPTWVKICGITSVADALMVQSAGASAIGLNFSSASPRFIDIPLARAIRQVLDKSIEVVGVFVDSSRAELLRIKQEVGLDTLQLHGAEPPQLLKELLLQEGSAYKAVRIGTRDDVRVAEFYPGSRILVDAKVPGMMGGSGKKFDWNLISTLNDKREMILAGGLNAQNVRAAVDAVAPYGVDTASGVEDSPGKKNEVQVREFVKNARLK